MQFISIEVNPDYVRQARENTRSAGIDVDIRHGLSVPQALLPTPEQVQLLISTAEKDEDPDMATFIALAAITGVNKVATAVTAVFSNISSSLA